MGVPLSTGDGGLDAWRALISASFVPLEARPAASGSFSGELAPHELGRVELTEVVADPCAVLRTSRLVRASSDRYLLVSLMLDGAGFVEQGDQRARVGPGDLVAYDSARPYRLLFPGATRQLVVQVPVGELGPAVDIPDVTARTLPRDDPAVRLVRAFLAELGRVAPSLDEADRPETGASTTALLATALRSRRPDNPTLRRLRGYLAGHLDDPGLDRSRLAAVVGTSPRHLSRTLAAAGTSPAALILATRLDAARRALADPRQDHRTVAAIAHQHGFTDPTVFGRAFRRRFGLPPSQVRAARGAPSGTGSSRR
jgi:AraC-like DNA-binding protein